MNDRERILNVLNYKEYDRLPIVHFGFWGELIDKWFAEGHLTEEELAGAKAGDGNPGEEMINRKLGFDTNYYTHFSPSNGLCPSFEQKVLETMPDGSRKVMNGNGVIMIEKDGAGSIPMEFDHMLKGRKEWDEEFKPRLQFNEERITRAWVNCDDGKKRYGEGGKEYLSSDHGRHMLLHCGSLYGRIRDRVGMENLCYLAVDDEELYDEMLDVEAELCYRCTEYTLQQGIKFNIGHFWEDICYKSGPLVNPKVFKEKVGPHYKRITDLLKKYGIELVSLDCDGLIDLLVPIWLENGVNVMFPIEVGTWNASIEPWRREYGKELRGVGGVRKHAFAEDYAAVDAEVERLRKLVDLGGYIPCPDHRIAPDAKWDNVCCYTEKMRKAFG